MAKRSKQTMNLPPMPPHIQQQIQARLNCHCLLTGTICDDHDIDWTWVDQDQQPTQDQQRDAHTVGRCGCPDC